MDRVQSRILWLLGSLLFVFFCLYAVWSYSLTDPNLVLSSWQPYWSAQQWLWQTLYHNPQLQANLYAGLMAAIWLLYGSILYRLHTSFSTQKMQGKHWLIIAVVLAPLFFAYNALSHDIFNYIFNAKMVVVYGANPHVQTALNFASDPWVRFMHNTHTTAPYGYGWTVLSVVPLMLGMGKFLLTWLLYKVAAMFSLVLLGLSANWFSNSVMKQPLSWFQAALLFLNPLLVIEVLGNGHNDLWMLVPALLAVGVGLQWGTRKIALLLGLLVWSISIKYATLVLLPLFIAILYTENVWERIRSRLVIRLPLKLIVPIAEKFFGEVVRKNVVGVSAATASLLLFLPLLTSRSQQFHPWYLIWALVWIPFISVKFVRVLLIAFSISSSFRYVPWVVAGGFEAGTLTQQQAITWIGGMTLMLLWYAVSSMQLRRSHTGLRKL